MSIQASTPVSRDLARVADRIAASALLRPEFCDRLARALSQLWSVAAPQFVDEDLGKFDAILIRLVPTTSLDTRVELSDRIADAEQAPRALLLVLAHDAIEVAGPILRRSPALADDDLVDVARRCGAGHMGAIAERPEISIRVSDVLVLRGDDLVRRTVCANPGAHLSDKSFARLSLQAREDESFGIVLVHRADLPELVVRFLRDNGSPTLRRALDERDSGRGVHDPLARISTSIRATEAGWLEPYDFEAAAAVLQRLGDARHHLDPFVRRLAQTDNFPEVVQVIAEVSGLPLDLVKHMMVSLDTEPFAKVARAVGLRVETVQEILMIGPWLHRLDARARDAALLVFQATTVDDARARLRRWVGDGTAGA